MSAQNFFENDLLELIFQNVAAPNLGDASGLQPSATAGSLYASLHTALPAETATAQTTSEAGYTGYARQAVARSTTGWTVVSGNADNAAAITFPRATAGNATASHFGLGSALSGAGNLFMTGALTSSLAISSNITPEFAQGDLNITLD